MNRIAVFSDTHNNISNCIKILDAIPFDLVIHLGDIVSDQLKLKKLYPDIKFRCIPGNNDCTQNTPSLCIFEEFGIKFLMTHGHLYSENTLYFKAEEEGCSFILTGHTHISKIKKEGKIVFINPGSISRPRDGTASYAVIEKDGNKINYDIIKINNYNLWRI